jgi:hypothetical protein
MMTGCHGEPSEASSCGSIFCWRQGEGVEKKAIKMSDSVGEKDSSSGEKATAIKLHGQSERIYILSD